MNKEIKEKNAEISERLAEILASAGVSSNFFAAKLGYQRSQTIYDILNGKSAPSYDFFKRFMLSEYSEIYNIDWLLTGRGDMLRDFDNYLSVLYPKQIMQRLMKEENKDVANIGLSDNAAVMVKLLEMIDTRDKRIKELTEENKKLHSENGTLCERYNNLMERWGAIVSSANNETSANAV